MRTLDVDWKAVKEILSDDPNPERVLRSLGSREAAVALPYTGVENPLETLRRSPRHSVDPLCVVLTEIHGRVADKVESWIPMACPDVRAASEFTREPVARAKAEFLRERVGGRSAMDLCSGIGADALALAEAYQEVLAVEKDDARMKASTINVDMHSSGNVEVVKGDATDVDPDGFDVVHADPTRGRAKRPDDTEPPVPELLERLEGASYLIEVPPAVRASKGTVVFSHSGSVRAVCTSNVVDGAAVVIADTGFEMEALPRDPVGEPRDLKEVGWVLEQDPAVRKARLSWKLARELGVEPTVADGVETVMWVPEGAEAPLEHPALKRVVEAWEEGEGPPVVVSVGVKTGARALRVLRRKYRRYDVVYVTPSGEIPGRLVSSGVGPG